MIRLAIILVIFLAALIFAVNNMEQQVAIWYFFGKTTEPIPFYFLILVAFFSGMILSILLIFPHWIKLRLELRKHKKILGKVEQKLSHLRPEKEGHGHGAGRGDETEY